jgi:signal peptidase I
MVRSYPLRKSKKILLHPCHHLARKRKDLSTTQLQQLENTIKALQEEVLRKNRQGASELAREIQSLSRVHMKKTFFEKARDFVLGLGFALLIAVVVRQMWFELYEIPSGSMRPTFKEQDRLAVSKSDFGINIPLTTGHFYFDPAHVKRNGIVIFTVENMDFRDGDTVYFYLFPGKKQLVKRLIGKPGDTLYFYGGKIYGLDSQGNDISSELQQPELAKIDHIPFINFEGKVSTTPSPIQGVYSPVIIYQMNEPIARLYATSMNQAKGELLPKVLSQDPNMHYRNLWGMENFAMARLLTKTQVRQFTDQDPSTLEDGVLYLELKHHPSLLNAKIGSDEYNHLRPMVGVTTSIIPLQEKHLKAIFDNLYTSRFIVKGGFARHWGSDPTRYHTFFPYLPGVPDGTYEFYYGKGYEVSWQGVTFELPPTHPLMRFDPQRLQLFFNIGIEFDSRVSPQSKEQYLAPPRYAYFRDGNLFLMGASIFEKNDPALLSFIEREKKKESTQRSQKPYRPFTDNGAPLLPDGRINADIISRYGIKVPPKSYLVLGDNYANSGDSRVFGFVPEENLRGAPDFIFWPPGSRFGHPNQPAYPLFTTSRVIVWILAGIGFGVWYIVHRRRSKLPIL